MKNKVKLTESIQSKSVEPACAEFPPNVVRNYAKQCLPLGDPRDLCANARFLLYYGQLNWNPLHALGCYTMKLSKLLKERARRLSCVKPYLAIEIIL